MTQDVFNQNIRAYKSPMLIFGTHIQYFTVLQLFIMYSNNALESYLNPHQQDWV